MRGYRISDLDSTTQQLIKDKNLDQNGDSLINEDNGELAELLSQAKVGSIQKLGKRDKRLEHLLMFELAGGAATGAAWLWSEAQVNNDNTAASRAYYKEMQQHAKAEEERINKMVNNLAKKNNITNKSTIEEVRKLVISADSRDCDITHLEYKWGGLAFREAPRPQQEVMAKCARNLKNAAKGASAVRLSPTESMTSAMFDMPKRLTSKKGLKFLKGIKGIKGLRGITAAAIATFAMLVNPFTMVPASVVTALAIQPGKRYEVGMGESDAVAEPKQPQAQTKPKTMPVVQPTEQEEIKAKFEEGFKELGISEDTELKEYIPQKGEYWISILKAKYGVDDAMARKMANKIKEIVYDDPKASKQTPVMYLPKTWTFEGKTYHYKESTKAVTTKEYSDDVKTEMGKMSKDIKYE